MRGSRRNAVTGVVLLDKPSGITSQTAVTRVKRLFAAGRAGHTGTLDPMARGLLPLCLGEATKFSHMLLDADKTYDAVVKLGVTTQTGDLEGEVTHVAKVSVQLAVLRSTVERFVGEILQTPPMYSAIKVAGRPLYEYARAGLALERTPRPVHIKAIDILGFTGDELRIRVTCSKGTYIRALAEDIGRALGCGGCLAELIRTAVGGFSIETAATLDALEQMTPDERERCKLPADALVATLPSVQLDAEQASRIETGRAVKVEMAASGPVRLYGPAQRYLGVGKVAVPGTIVPQRLMATMDPRAAQGEARRGRGLVVKSDTYRVE